MTPITRAQRLTDHQLYLELVRFIDSAELADDEIAVIEEAAQRLASKVPYDLHRLTQYTRSQADNYAYRLRKVQKVSVYCTHMINSLGVRVYRIEEDVPCPALLKSPPATISLTY